MTVQILAFSRDLVLKILLKTYYEQGTAPEVTGVQKMSKIKCVSLRAWDIRDAMRATLGN